jgi:CHASE3 domain sensor protein
VSDAASVAFRPVPPAKGGQVLWLTVGVTLLLIALASAALLMISSELQAGRSSYFDILHRRATLDQVRIVLSSLQDAENGVHAYVLTGKEEGLAPYYAAERSLDSQLDRLTQLVRIHASQATR